LAGKKRGRAPPRQERGGLRARLLKGGGKEGVVEKELTGRKKAPTAKKGGESLAITGVHSFEEKRKGRDSAREEGGTKKLESGRGKVREERVSHWIGGLDQRGGLRG